MSQNVATEKNLEVLLALAAGTRPADVAERFGATRRSVERWLRKPAFRRKVGNIRNQMIAAAVGRMADNMTFAADALVALLADKDPAVRLRAARAVLSLGLRLRDGVEVGERLRDLEAELARKTRGLP